MDKTIYVCTVLAVMTSMTVDSANILAIFPTASYSHQMPLLGVARALADRGHNLTVITTNPLKEPKANYTEVDISFSYTYWKPNGKDQPVVNLQKKMGPFEIIKMFIFITHKLVDLQLNSTPVQNFIRYIDKEKPKFDLVLYEDLMHTAYLALLPKIGNPPLVSMLTLALPCGLDFSFGNVCNPSYVPDILIGHTNKMTFFERVQNYLLIYIMNYYITPIVLRDQDGLAKKYFNFTGSTQQIAKNKSLLMLTTSWLYQYPRPVFPNTINLGPTHIGDTKPLPQDLQEWIEGAEEGVIYFSLGSNMRSASLEEGKRNAILSIFARFPKHRVIWKWEEEQTPGLPGNVICRKWLPQHDLLAHPKIKLFITQGGLQSLQESVYFEVPMIGIPFFGDQLYNVKIIERLGIGGYLDFDDILKNPEDLFVLMKEILYNRRYMDTVKKLSSLSKTQMLSPRDTAIWWVEYVLKFGGKLNHMQPEQWYWEMPWYQYSGLDVLLLVLSPFVFLLFLIYFAISRLRRRFSGGKLKKS